MSELARVALTAILSLARPPAVDPVAERPRIEQLAAAIADAVVEHDEFADWLGETPLPVAGSRSREATAIILVAIAAGESRFAADVADCRRVGADHPSITAWQLHGRWAFGPYTRHELCASPQLAAERALWVLAHHAAKCGTPAAATRGFSSGDCGRDSRAAREHCRRWERLARSAGLRVSCQRRDAE